MEERARTALNRLLREAKVSGDAAVRFDIHADRWAEVVSDIAGRDVEIIRDPNPSLPRRFRSVPVRLVEFKEPKIAVMVCRSGATFSA